MKKLFSIVHVLVLSIEMRGNRCREICFRGKFLFFSGKVGEEKGRINGSFRGKSISRVSFIGRKKRLGIESGRDEDNDERTRNDLSTIFLLFEFRPGDVANVLRDET